MLVCSAMSLISSTMLPISWELSPKRLMRLLVSWMVSRIAFIPSIVRRTASPPLWAMSTECLATSEQRSELPDTSSMEAAMSAMDSLAAEICRDCALLAGAPYVDRFQMGPGERAEHRGGKPQQQQDPDLVTRAGIGSGR